MKIVHIPCAYFPVKGGTELRVQRISEILVSLGHDVTVLTADVGSISGYFELGVNKITRKNEVIKNVCIVRLSYGDLIYKIGSFFANFIFIKKIKIQFNAKVLGFCYRQFSKNLQEYIRHLRPDVVMATPHLLPNVEAAIEACKSSSFPLVISPCLHEDDPDWPKLKMTTALKYADVVLAMTDYEKHRLVDCYSVPRERIFTAGLGVDLPDSSEIATIQREGKILFLGRKVLKKNIPLLVEAMKLVWEKYPEIILVLAGARSPDSKDIDKFLYSLPEQYRNRIESVDDITESEKSLLLSTSLCLALPSRIESFGGVILEAWAYATPVIAFDLPVFRSFVTSWQDGILIKPDSAEILAQAISRLIRDQNLARSLGKAGRIKVENQFTWEKVALRYLQGYEYAIATSKVKKS